MTVSKFMRESIESSGTGEQSELQTLAREFTARVAELRKLGPFKRGFEMWFKKLETVVDTQFILRCGSEDKIRQAIKLVDHAIAEIGSYKQRGRTPWSDQGEFVDWMKSISRLAGEHFKD